MSHPYRIVIFGAGSVGCYVGGRLLSADASVTMIGRPRLASVFQEQPLKVTDYEGFEHQTSLTPAQYSTDVAQAKDADLVLVTTKSAATEDAGRQLADVLKPGTPVISLQNGISNAERLQAMLPDCTVLAGMIPFNVVQKAPGHFHHGTEGHLMATQHPSLDEALAWFQRAGLPIETRADMPDVMWSKLLLNLNNPINALSGVPLLEQLAQRDYRRCLAMAQQETLTLLEMAGIKTVNLTPVPMQLIPYLMKSPDWLFSRLARKMLAIDPIARSSMWEDLEAGRPTEVDWINGEVVNLAEQLSVRAPINQTLANLVHQHEQGQRQDWPAEALLKYLKQALDDYHPVKG
ncbi:2-dehydropantoate 2-reductase [Marinobacter caseinilyticus]|uniref:2-dehydropantoate 2-reductase n=1 Tax=Marinobacter caseinilyticus TaxID=2692195 RepID=UPI00140A70C0|nr:2-dehydropantoate 2-reductase [Marinobacter caseinilyticus]